MFMFASLMTLTAWSFDHCFVRLLLCGLVSAGGIGNAFQFLVPCSGNGSYTIVTIVFCYMLGWCFNSSEKERP